MPRVKIDYVVSFSSEDPENPANNLLAREVSKKKWLCKTRESSASVVLQLAKAVKISAVHVGAYHAALVEVLVGRSEKPDEQFQVLVPSSVFASSLESRRGPTERVRSFCGAQLAPAAAQRWDRVRLVCSQPYNKHCKYGISFIHLDSAEESDVAASVTSSVPSRMFNVDSATFSSDEEEFHPGELFAKHVQGQDQQPSTESQIRQASSHAMKNLSDSSSRLTKTPISKHVSASPSPNPSPAPRTAATTAATTAADRRRDALMYDVTDTQPHAHIDRLVDNHRQQKDNEQKQKASKENIDKKNKEKLDTAKVKDRHKREEDSRSASETNTTHRDVGDRRDTDRQTRKARDTTASTRDTAASPRDTTASTRDSVGNKRHNDNKQSDSASEKRGETRGKRPRGEGRAKNGDDGVGDRCSSPLRAVVFAISGYQNPTRATLRDTALRLGARYQRDWTPACTHLICAFPNTPKLRQLRSGGGGVSASVKPAVRGEWVTQCAARSRLLPWRWFATEPQYRVTPPDPPDQDHDDDEPSSERDTDDEIEEALRNQKKRRRHSPDAHKQTDVPPASPPRPDAHVDAPDAALDDSDVAFVRDERIRGNVTVHDSDSEHTDTDDAPFNTQHQIDEAKCLPNFFEGYTFAIDSSVTRADLLARYVHAYGGVIVQQESTCADYLVCEGKEGKLGSRSPYTVSPRWLWACHRRRTLLPLTEC